MSSRVEDPQETETGDGPHIPVSGRMAISMECPLGRGNGVVQ